jgi:hypothetical protein
MDHNGWQHIIRQSPEMGAGLKIPWAPRCASGSGHSQPVQKPPIHGLRAVNDRPIRSVPIGA